MIKSCSNLSSYKVFERKVVFEMIFCFGLFINWIIEAYKQNCQV